MTTIETRWWWIRHAPVQGPNHHIYGQRDLDADTSNTAIFEALARYLPSDAVLVSSDLARTQQTAAAIAAAGLALPEPILDPALREIHFGDWQGVRRDEFRNSRGEKHGQFWLAAAGERAPNGESFLDLMARVAPAIDRLTEDHAGRDIICTAHGGTIRAALSYTMGIDPETALAFATDNCAVTRLDHFSGPGRGVWRAVTINRSPL